MVATSARDPRKRPLPQPLPWLVLAAGLVLAGGCSGGGGDDGGGGTGTVSVTLSDPPTCEAPAGPFTNVWVTVTHVRAHVDGSAGSNAPGWVDLVDLRSAPRQIDLLNIGTTTCLLTQLGSTTGLPPGDYQQIRLHLLGNNPGPNAAVPSPNMCAGTGGFNCVVTAQGPQPLLLGSQANTGLKVPPGRIVGGPIQLASGQAADINIDFDACRSVIEQGNGMFRLKPTLSAGEVSLNQNAITGRVVSSTTGQPIGGATVIVLAERPDAGGTDRIVSQTLGDPNDGTFSLCPLPIGTYDLVVAALDAGGTPHGPTALIAVDVGTAVGDIPVDAETAAPATPATVTGLVTASTSMGTGADVDVEVSALQTVMPAGGPAFELTVPLFPGSGPLVATSNQPSCPMNTFCATYALVVPTLNARVGVFDPAGTSFTPPPPAPVMVFASATATEPMSGGDPICSPSTMRTALDPMGGPLVVAPGAMVTAEMLDFTGCE